MTTYDRVKYAIKLHQRIEKYSRLGIDTSLIDHDHVEKTLEWLDKFFEEVEQ